MSERQPLYFQNTLSREKERFHPLAEGLVSMYSCGPTVYNFAHIGNLRQYVFVDILRRVLRRNGYALRHVMNITDVGHLVSDADTGEDKLARRAREQQKTPWEIAEEYTKAFFEDTAALNIERPEFTPRATDHIPQMLRFVEGLIEKGYGYEISDGIYFDVAKFKDYGKLSRIDLEEQLAGARVGVNPEKRNPADFALWIKAPKEHIMQWESPWGMGYPGWHIECSAMSMHYLGERFDIHMGGVDHIPVHHENEIAQSDGLIGRKSVNLWMHGEFLMVDNGKMSKSLGNVYTAADLRAKGYDPLAFRYFCLNAHYRNKLNFTWDGMRAAQISYRRFLEGAIAHWDADARTADDADADANRSEGVDVDAIRTAFDAALNDDLNVPKALGIAWQVVRNPKKSQALFELLLDMDTVFGLGLAEAASASGAGAAVGGGVGAGENANAAGTDSGERQELPPEVAAILEERAAARAAKDWKKSDELRDALKARGF
ncbi:MAG: cysteine--tRNA ligase, partial [Clostridiales bacterium]|nr:cysteine--tRNA ligase [Clostridiales bacterium]